MGGGVQLPYRPRGATHDARRAFAQSVRRTVASLPEVDQLALFDDLDELAVSDD